MSEDFELRGWRDRVAEWLAARNLLVGGIATAAAPVVTVTLPAVMGWTHVGLVIGLAFLAVVGFAIPAARARLAEKRATAAEGAAAAAGEAMQFALSNSMIPLLSSVVTGVDPRSDDKSAAIGGAIQGVLASATRLCGGGLGIRACWYRLEYDSTGKAEAFRPRAYFGRSVRPSTIFPVDQERGVALMDLLTRRHRELWPDLDVKKADGWTPTRNSTSYKSCLIVPVYSEYDHFGLLMIDADKPSVLAESDVLMAQHLGLILALALSHQNDPDCRSCQHANDRGLPAA